MGWADLHSHILPGIDDGARDLSEAMQLLRGLLELGFDEISFTPHQKAGSLMPSEDEIRQARASMPEVQGVRMHLAAENFWDTVFFERSAALSFPRYGVEGKSFLFELPPATLPPQIDEHLFRFRVRGLLPVMAHPERYAALQRDLERATPLARVAALVVDLGALGGHHGDAARDTARMLVQRGVAHAAASDIHHEDDLREVADGIAWLRKKVGEVGLRRLLDEGPRSILCGELPETE